LISPPPPTSTLFPYTTLFRSVDFDFTPAVATNATVSSAMPIILAGQKVFIAAPANPLPGLTIQRTGRLDSNELPTPYSTQLNVRSEEHTSELQSQSNLVCRLL